MFFALPPKAQRKPGETNRVTLRGPSPIANIIGKLDAPGYVYMERKWTMVTADSKNKALTTIGEEVRHAYEDALPHFEIPLPSTMHASADICMPARCSRIHTVGA